MTHNQARAVLLSVWKSVTGQDPTLPELQYAQAVGLHEGGYGAGFDRMYPDAAPTNNWGAVQCTIHKQAVEGHCFIAKDSHADGTVFYWPYRKYGSPEEGAADYLRLITVRRPKTWAAMKQGDVRTASHELYGYYTGHGTREQGEAQHRTAIMRRGTEIAKAMGEPLKLWVDAASSGGIGIVALGIIIVGLLVSNIGGKK